MPTGISHRVGARAVIPHNGCLLLNRFGEGEYYNFPGGGTEPGEISVETLVREVHEETGLVVTAGRMLFILEYEPCHCDYIYGGMPSISIFYECALSGSDVILPPFIPDINPDQPDMTSRAIWVEYDSLHRLNILPRIHKPLEVYLKTGVFTPNILFEPLIK